MDVRDASSYYIFNEIGNKGSQMRKTKKKKKIKALMTISYQNVHLRKIVFYSTGSLPSFFDNQKDYLIFFIFKRVP